MTDHTGPFYVTAGQRFAEAGNHMINGIQEIQKLSQRDEWIRDDGDNELIARLLAERQATAEICEKLVGPYKILVVAVDR